MQKDSLPPKEISEKIFQKFKSLPHNLKFIDSGEISSAFSFDINGQGYIIRISSESSGFNTDQQISNLFSSVNHLIPKAYFVGPISNKYFSITAKCTGTVMDKLNDDKLYQVLPDFVAQIHSLHTQDLKTTQGFGPVSSNGNGKFKSWKNFLLSSSKNSTEYWPENYHQQHLKLIENNIELIPEIRSLIHGDLGFNNILVSGNKLSGIIDWSDAKYGDFVYDIAYLYFWSSTIDHLKIFFNYYSQQNRLDLSNFKDRIFVYTIFIGLSLLDYFSGTGQQESFYQIQKRLDQTLKLLS